MKDGGSGHREEIPGWWEGVRVGGGWRVTGPCQGSRKRTALTPLDAALSEVGAACSLPRPR